MKKGEIKNTKSGKKYILVKKLGRGGQASVWEVENVETKQHFAYKEYKHDKNNVKENIEELIRIGKFYDKDGGPINEVVLPLDIVECGNDSFGYIMNLVDLQDFTVIRKAWSSPDKYPSCKAICKIMQSFAKVFETLHNKYGICYKDVNEGNIFFNPKTGDIRIIDNDNIGSAGKLTIRGTLGYRAPEVIAGENPDHNSDRFSLAVFAYRLLTGGYPFDGPWTDEYCKQNDVILQEAEKVVYGTNAVFAWNPVDKRNSIDNSSDPLRRGQAEYWNRLPDIIKDMFISTFVTNLSKDRRAERTSDTEWRETFHTIEKHLVKCPKCGKETFSEAGKCFECAADLNVFEKKSNKAKQILGFFKEKALLNSGVVSSAVVKKPRHKAVIKILSIGEVKREIVICTSEEFTATMVSKNLQSGKIFKVLYNKKLHKMGLMNLSTIQWTIVKSDKTKALCRPGEILTIEDGMMIRIIPKRVQLNIVSVS